MEALRTPESCFEGIAWGPSSYVPTGTGGVELAVVDLGLRDAPVALLLHGEPSWSYLWRHVALTLVDAGVRVVAPDLVGFGRSDKPVDRAAHTYAAHVEWLRHSLFSELDLTGVTLVGQDWGGLLGLRLLAAHPERFRGVVAANTGLPDGSVRLPEVWWRFRQVVETADELAVGQLVQAGVQRTLGDEERAAYDAPFPDEAHKAGPRAMPGLVPQDPGQDGSADNRAAWAVLRALEVPLVTAFSDGDPITAGGEALLETLPGAAGQPHRRLSGGHFLQEDSPLDLAEVVIDLVRRTSQ